MLKAYLHQQAFIVAVLEGSGETPGPARETTALARKGGAPWDEWLSD